MSSTEGFRVCRANTKEYIETNERKAKYRLHIMLPNGFNMVVESQHNATYTVNSFYMGIGQMFPGNGSCINILRRRHFVILSKTP